MKLGHAIRGCSVALVALLLSACGSSDDGTGLLDTNPASSLPTLTITGPDNLVSGTSQDYRVTALDRDGDPVKGVSVSLSTDLGTLSQASSNAVTDANGELTFTLSANSTSNSGVITPVSGTATVTARGTVEDRQVDDDKIVSMAPTVFQFTSPADGSRVPVSTLEPLVLQWTENKVAISSPVTFAAKVGTLTDASGNVASTLTVTTDSNGFARLQIVSSTAGDEVVTATAGDFKATLGLTYFGDPATFTATAASPIDAAAGASTIGVKVVDASGSAVAGATVSFSITSAPSAGTLSPVTATTNSTGVANAIYRANGVAGTAKISVTVGTLAPQTVTIVINS